MNKSKYYIRVTPTHETKFKNYLSTNNIEYDRLSVDMANGEASCLYSLNMDEEEALSLKLSLVLKGCLKGLY